MINRLIANLPNHNIVSEDSQELYIVDYKHINGGNVTISNIHPNVAHIFINNPNAIPIYFDGFEENALEISVEIIVLSVSASCFHKFA